MPPTRPATVLGIATSAYVPLGLTGGNDVGAELFSLPRQDIGPKIYEAYSSTFTGDGRRADYLPETLVLGQTTAY